jgi:hypothetical protein
MLKFYPMAQEENPPKEGDLVRKVVQISTMVQPEKDWAFIALCDDGSLWLYHGSWLRIENVPQTLMCSVATTLVVLAYRRASRSLILRRCTAALSRP